MFAKDTIYTAQELDQQLPSLRVVGGQLPIITLTNCTLRKAVVTATKRALDTGLDVRVLGFGGKVLAQADGD